MPTQPDEVVPNSGDNDFIFSQAIPTNSKPNSKTRCGLRFSIVLVADSPSSEEEAKDEHQRIKETRHGQGA